MVSLGLKSDFLWVLYTWTAAWASIIGHFPYSWLGWPLAGEQLVNYHLLHWWPSPHIAHRELTSLCLWIHSL